MTSEIYPKRRQREWGAYACIVPLVAGFGLAHFFSDAHSKMDVNLGTAGVALLFSGMVSAAIAKHSFDHEKSLRDIFRGKAVYAGLGAAALVGGAVGYGASSDNLVKNQRLAEARLIPSDTVMTITRTLSQLHCGYHNQGQEVLVQNDQGQYFKIKCPDKMP